MILFGNQGRRFFLEIEMKEVITTRGIPYGRQWIERIDREGEKYKDPLSPPTAFTGEGGGCNVNGAKMVTHQRLHSFLSNAILLERRL